jgi:hypothetical protein
MPHATSTNNVYLRTSYFLYFRYGGLQSGFFLDINHAQDAGACQVGGLVLLRECRVWAWLSWPTDQCGMEWQMCRLESGNAQVENIDSTYLSLGLPTFNP